MRVCYNLTSICVNNDRHLINIIIIIALILTPLISRIYISNHFIRLKCQVVCEYVDDIMDQFSFQIGIYLCVWIVGWYRGGWEEVIGFFLSNFLFPQKINSSNKSHRHKSTSHIIQQSHTMQYIFVYNFAISSIYIQVIWFDFFFGEYH